MSDLAPISTHLLPYLLIPCIAALVGWSTNWIAVKLMFYPLNFKGYRPLRIGWQGVIPSKADKMARVVVKQGLSSLASVAEVYSALDREMLVEQFAKEMSSRLDEYIDEVMLKENPVLWEKAPTIIKKRVMKSLEKLLPVMTRDVLEELGQHIEAIFDLELMVERRLSEDKALLCQIFQESGGAEFRFIVKSGLYLGFMFGCIQMVFWALFPQWWVLPLFGVLVGYATNDIALKMIFKPLNPIHVGPVSLQGLFLKRQKAVAEVLCRITTQKIITINHILQEILSGPKRGRVHLLIHKHIGAAVDQIADLGLGIGKPITQAAFGLKGYATLKASASETAIHFLSSDLQDNHMLGQGQAEVINRLLRERMEQLTPEAFQGILRPAFQEDELTLILIGAFLGGTVGALQLLLFF